MTDEQFERAVEDALDTIPERFWEQLDNVIFAVEDEPTEEELSGSGDDNASFSDDELLGLYDGIPLTERGVYYGEGDVPDVITIFKGPHERCFEEREAIHAEVRKTVIHEIGHFFGNDEAVLEAMGY